MKKTTIAELAKALKAAGGSFQSSVAAIAPDMEEPLKTKWQKTIEAMQVTLASIPDPDKLTDEDTEQAFVTLANTSQSVIDGQQASLKDLSEKLASIKAALPGEIASALDAQVKAGAFLTKADHDQKLADAVSAATTAARASAVSELKVVGERKLQLATASIPVPADEVLAGDEKDFAPKKDAAAKRAEEIKSFKLPPERVLALCWNADEAQYQDTLTLMKQAFEAAGKPTAPNPFAKRTGSDTPSNPTAGLC